MRVAVVARMSLAPKFQGTDAANHGKPLFSHASAHGDGASDDIAMISAWLLIIIMTASSTRVLVQLYGRTLLLVPVQL